MNNTVDGKYVWPDGEQEIETLYFDYDNSIMYRSGSDILKERTKGCKYYRDAWFSPDKTQLLYSFSRHVIPTYCGTWLKIKRLRER